MKNKKKMTVLVIQLIALILFVFSYKSYTDSVVKPIKVYQFARTISEGTEISQKDLVVTEVAANTYSDNMILQSDISSIIGKYTTTKVYADTLCYAEQFGDLNESNSMFASLDLSNARLMSLKVDINDVGGYLEAGDRIDLMFTAEGNANIISLNPSTDSSDSQKEKEENETTSENFVYSKVFLQNVIVYEVLGSGGFKYVNRAERYPGDVAVNIDASDPTVVDDGGIAQVILIVSPEEAEEIKTREATGEITVIKRFNESETHDTLGYIIGNYGKIFSGNANAETSSLQIISTIQDTDANEDVGTSSENIYNTSAGGGVNNATQNNPNNNSDDSDNSEAIIGGSSAN